MEMEMEKDQPRDSTIETTSEHASMDVASELRQ
jgi:hypothetical protein